MRFISSLFVIALAAACSDGMPALFPPDAGTPLAVAPDAGTPDAGAPDAGPDTSALITARPYALHVPTSYDPAKPTPLVILLHGYRASGAIQESYFRLTAVADAQTFLYATPDGTIDANGQRFWNATDSCCDVYASHVDDVAYIGAIIDDVQRHFHLDSKRVYIVGHSNGGFMAHRLACDLSTRIAAIVSLAGAQWLDISRCQPSEPVAVLQVHGDADTVVQYAGGHPEGYVVLPVHPGAVQTVADWAALDGCDATLVDTTTRLDLDSTLFGAETVVARHDHCHPGGAAELWTIHGGSHIPWFTAEWAGDVYGFLAAHPKP
jgi:polyhydroxybutyrate depolymerase